MTPSLGIEPLLSMRLAVAGPAPVDVTTPASPPDPEPIAAYATERGARFLWPALGAAHYADTAAAPLRLALKAWPYGTGSLAPPPQHGVPAVLYLAADVTYLRMLAGAEEPLAASAAYERALRGAPEFPDAPRALVMLGVSQLRSGLAPEAQTSFARVERDHAGSAYAALATIGRATALRLQRRVDDARHLLATLPATLPVAVRCEVLEEEAMVARARGDHAGATSIDARLLATCGGTPTIARTLEARVDSLLAVGRRPEARQALLAGAAGLPPDAEATALVRAAALAREDGDLEAARDLLDRAVGLRLTEATKSVVEAHRARLDAITTPERALATLDRLDRQAPTNAARSAILGVWADTLVDQGRFDDALGLLDDAERASAVEAVTRLRGAVLARWIARLSPQGGAVDVVTLYARYRTLLDTYASPPTTLAVAEALASVGLRDVALRLLRLHTADGDPTVVLSAAELALALVQPDVARQELARLDAVVIAPEQARRRALLERRLASADGGLDAVSSVPETDVAPVIEELAALDEPVLRRGGELLMRTRAFGRAGDGDAR